MPRVGQEADHREQGAQRRAARQSANSVANRRSDTVVTDLPAARLRDERHRLRFGIQRVTGLERVQLCGRRMAFGAAGVEVRANPGGLASYSGVQTCGSVWVCPPCAAKIRTARAEEVQLAAERHVALGGGVVFGTLTLRHRRSDPLQQSMDAVPEAWRRVQQDGTLRRLRKRYGFGFLRAVEQTWTRENGWHVHAHVVLLTDTVLDDDALAAITERITDVWQAAALALTGRMPSRSRGSQWERSTRAADAAGYLTKLQEPDREGWSVGAELVRSDAKRGRASRASLHPFEIAQRAVHGDAVMFRLWREYEHATHRRRALTWSRGLRDRLLPDRDALEDEQLAAAAEGVEVVGTLDSLDFHAVKRAGLLLVLLQAVERDGRRGFDRIVERSHARTGPADWLSLRETHAQRALLARTGT